MLDLDIDEWQGTRTPIGEHVNWSKHTRDWGYFSSLRLVLRLWKWWRLAKADARRHRKMRKKDPANYVFRTVRELTFHTEN